MPCAAGICIADFPTLTNKQKLEVHRATCWIDAPSANLSDVQIFTGNPPSFQFFYYLALDSENATSSLHSQDGTFITRKRGDPVKAFFNYTNAAPQNSPAPFSGSCLPIPKCNRAALEAAGVDFTNGARRGCGWRRGQAWLGRRVNAPGPMNNSRGLRRLRRQPSRSSNSSGTKLVRKPNGYVISGWRKRQRSVSRNWTRSRNEPLQCAPEPSRFSAATIASA